MLDWCMYLSCHTLYIRTKDISKVVRIRFFYYCFGFLNTFKIYLMYDKIIAIGRNLLRIYSDRLFRPEIVFQCIVLNIWSKTKNVSITFFSSQATQRYLKSIKWSMNNSTLLSYIRVYINYRLINMLKFKYENIYCSF